MPARKAFIIDRAKSSCRVDVMETLNGHRLGTSPAEHVRECYTPKIISRFHPPPLLAFRGYPSWSARPQVRGTVEPDRHQITAPINRLLSRWLHGGCGPHHIPPVYGWLVFKSSI